jgi:Dock homology region 2
LQDAKIHRFIRLLRLSSSTFQSFVDLPRHANFPSQVDKGLSPWLLQESFNTVIAATILVVEQSAPILSHSTLEKMKVLTGIMDLLLHLLSTPQSVVTHLRAMGGSLQCLDLFGVEDFLEAAGSSVQHWFRVVICLMNSTSLAVRAIAVDFVLSLLGNEFDRCGNIDSLSTVFVTVLPEVAAREIALCSVSGLVSTSDDLARCLWPLRRALADFEGVNPLEDDRIDPSLTPILSVLSRACQAVLDSVLIELRLKGSNLTVVGAKIRQTADSGVLFDADEESLFEAASFFDAESAPMQRLRWLLTLRELHEAKGNWLEAAETLYQCSKVIFDSMAHLKHVWRPSIFALWSDSRRSIWLDTVGEDLGQPDRGNMQVMEFAEQFLEPSTLLDLSWKPTATGKLRQPIISDMTVLWGRVSNQMMKLYRKEEGFDDLTQVRLGSVLKDAMEVMDRHTSRTPPRRGAKWTGSIALKRHVEDENYCRRLVASISGDIVQLSEKILKNGGLPREDAMSTYVAVRLSGKEPQRFRESTALPAFLERDAYCVCRVPLSLRDATESTSTGLVGRYGSRLAESLRAYDRAATIVLVTEATPQEDVPNDASVTYLHVYALDSVSLSTEGTGWNRSKSFFYRKNVLAEGGFPGENTSTVVELKVAHEFPYALSRQRVVLTSEIGFH